MSAVPLLSWGNHPPFPQRARSCHWPADVLPQLAALKEEQGNTLAYGAGRSYGDSCLAASDHVLHMAALDRFLAADWSTGRLTAEAGVTLADILAVAIPRGWFLPVTPGTRFVTLGGAIANDVHGKNHHRRGTFGRHVRRFGLCRSDAGRLTCSPAQEPLLFAATIGGLGLTGVIEWAEIQLMPIRSSRLDVVTQRFGNLDEFFTLSAELDASHEFGVAWIDCVASGRQAGRGVYVAGDFAGDAGLAVEDGRTLTVPVTPPFSLVNSVSLRLFNSLYWHRAPAVRRHSVSGYAPFFYPLDGLLQWNRLYGRRGFQQYQAVLPMAVAHDGVQALLEAIARSGMGSFLAVLKRCGDLSSPGLLSFPRPGITLALDFPQCNALAADLFPRLDAIVREAGGRLYPAKDAHMSGADFRHAYPAWAQLETLRDPALLSRFWQRVTL